MMNIHKGFVHDEFHQHHLHENERVIEEFQKVQLDFFHIYPNQIQHHYHLHQQHEDLSNKFKLLLSIEKKKQERIILRLLVQ